MKCAAGIVLYNPDIKRLKENIDAIYPQVDALVLVDNGSKNKSEIDTLVKTYKHICIISNTENYGIAKALNEIVNAAGEMGFEWVLTLDQDSVCLDGLINVYEEALQFNPDAGIISCKYIDRNIRLSAEDCTRKASDVLEEDSVKTKAVDFCITSASFTNVERVKAVGGFDERMFIDAVDYDICYALKRVGYDIIEVDCYGLLHEVGHSEAHKFLGHTFIAYNHSKWRNYYWARNRVYITRKYNLGKGIMIKRLTSKILVVFLYEQDKLGKISALMRGIKDGRKMPLPT